MANFTTPRVARGDARRIQIHHDCEIVGFAFVTPACAENACCRDPTTIQHSGRETRGACQQALGCRCNPDVPEDRRLELIDCILRDMMTTRLPCNQVHSKSIGVRIRDC